LIFHWSWETHGTQLVRRWTLEFGNFRSNLNFSSNLFQTFHTASSNILNTSILPPHETLNDVILEFIYNQLKYNSDTVVRSNILRIITVPCNTINHYIWIILLPTRYVSYDPLRNIHQDNETYNSCIGLHMILPIETQLRIMVYFDVWSFSVVVKQRVAAESWK
jgi:hypothetical protein